MKALFTKPGVQDEDLIKLTNVVVSWDMERRSKLGSPDGQKSSTVNEVDVSRVEGVAQPEATDLKVKVAEKERSRKEKFMAAPQAARHPEARISEKE